VKDAHVVLSDLSHDALAVARKNAEALGVGERTEFICGDLAEPFLARGMSGAFDLVASNPPYIASEEIPYLPRACASLSRDWRWTEAQAGLTS